MNLIPSPSSIWTAGIGSAEGLSALIVLFLWFVTIFFLSFTVKKYFSAKKHINFFVDLVDGLSPEELYEKQREIRNKAKQHEYDGDLWREFDETLVAVSERRRLCNTYDASHFFNTHSLAEGLTENRLLAAVPGFLTAVGVIGTFAGLQMGLSSMNLSKSDLDSLQEGIFTMIDGASIAFITSVWGVTCSLIFNVIEKSLERHVRSKIGILQNKIDFLYPRITAEHTLVTIEGYNRESTSALQGLAEKIGDQMQQVMSDASNNIVEGIEGSLGRITSSLVESVNQGSEKALESMLDRFMDGVGEAGEKQRKMMESTTEEMYIAINSMGSQVADFTISMQKQASEQQQKYEEQFKRLGLFQTAQQRALGENFKQMLDVSQEAVGDVADKLVKQVDLQAQREQSRSEQLMMLITEQCSKEQVRSEKIEQLLTNTVSEQRELAKHIEEIIALQKVSQLSVNGQLEELLTSFERVGAKNLEIVDSISIATSSLKETSNSLDTLSENISSSVKLLGDQTTEIATKMAEMIEQNMKLGGELTGVSETINGLVQRMTETATTMDSASSQAEKGLTAVNQHFNELTNSLSEHVEELETKVAELLSSYSSQVQVQVGERMNEWNSQTSQYISSMTDAVLQIGNVVDEMEMKVGNN